MTVPSTLERILAIVARRFSITDVKASDDIFSRLQIDSVQSLSLLTEIESEFDVEIPDYEFADVRTFAQLAQLVEDHTG